MQCMVVRCLRKGLLGTNGVREARHQEVQKKNGYLIPPVTQLQTLSRKEGRLISEHGKRKLGFIAASLAMVKAFPSGIGHLPEEFHRYHDLSPQTTALSSGFMDLCK